MKRSIWYALLAIFIGILVLGTLAAAFLPALLSTPFFSSRIIEAINKRIPGQLEIGNLELSWLSGQKIENLSLMSSSNEQIVHIDQVETDGSLLSFLKNGLQVGNLRITGLSSTLMQDERGATNLENALGLKFMEREDSIHPVNLENVNLDIHLGANRELRARAVGLTHQDHIKGQFNLDVQLGELNQLHLSAERFPVLILDQLSAIKNPHLSGLLPKLIGEFFDITVDQSGSQNQMDWHIIAKSPFVQADLNGQLEKGQILIRPESSVDLMMEPEAFKRLAASFGEEFHPIDPFSARLTFDHLTVFLWPVFDVTGKAIFKVDSNSYQFADAATLEVKDLNALWNAPEENHEVHLTATSALNYKTQPASLDLKLQTDRALLFYHDFKDLMREGISIQANLDAQTSLNSPLGAFLTGNLRGIVREKDSQLHLSLDSEKLSIADALITIERLALQDWIDKRRITHPILITFQSNDQKQLSGTFNFDSTDNLNFAEMQLNLHLHRFPVQYLQKFVPEEPLAPLLGETLNGEIQATRLGTSDIDGTLHLSTSNAFFKAFNGKCTLFNHQKDISFSLHAQQVQGSTEVEGTLNNLWDSNGVVHLERVNIILQASLHDVPTFLSARLALSDQAMARKLEAILGSQVNAEITTNIQNRQGPLHLQVKGLNGQLALDGRIRNGTLFLDKPLKASMQITPQVEKLILEPIAPFLGSIVKADQAIEFTIDPVGFMLPFHAPEQVMISHGALELHKIWFGREGQLGKVASLLGINSNPFEVWFTPVYFSMQKSLLTLHRMDMLIAGGYPLAGWGTADFGRNLLRAVIGISGSALKKAFAISNIKNSFFLQIPVHGSIDHPELDTSRAAARLSALVAQSQVKGAQGKLIGTIVEAAGDLLDPASVPAPTTNPLPWESAYQDSLETEKSKPVDSTQKMIEKPLKEIEKGAKSILKSILGK